MNVFDDGLGANVFTNAGDNVFNDGLGNNVFGGESPPPPPGGPNLTTVRLTTDTLSATSLTDTELI